MDNSNQSVRFPFINGSLRMIQRFYDQVLHRMSPDRRARKLAVVKALARNSLHFENKENEPTTNINNKTFTLKESSLIHSTPKRQPQVVTDLDAMDTELCSNISSLEESKNRDKSFVRSRFQGKRSKERRKSSLPRLERYSTMEPSDPKVEEPKENHDAETTKENATLKKEVDQVEFNSTEFLTEALGEEMYKSLDDYRPNVSTSNLLEEIEAVLPSSCSLVAKLDHTFHTVSGYRTLTRLTRLTNGLSDSQPKTVDHHADSNSLAKKIKSLEVEATVQKILTEQAEKAVKFSRHCKTIGIEHVESEKALLVSKLRYEVTMREIERLKMKDIEIEDENYGQLTISNIFLDIDSSNRHFDHYFCVAVERETLLSSPVVTASSQQCDGKLHFDEPFRFQKLDQDFVVNLKLYRFSIKESKVLKRSVLNKIKHVSTSLSGSSGHSSEASPKFECIGCAELRLHDIARAEFGKIVISNCMRSEPPLTSSNWTVFVKTGVNIETKISGFLNVFKQACWHRRWFCQSGYFLEAWQYPEDQENGKVPVDSMLLLDGTTVRPVDIEVCVRPHSFAFSTSDATINLLFSADSHKDMVEWISHLNIAIHHFRIWRPDF